MNSTIYKWIFGRGTNVEVCDASHLAVKIDVIEHHLTLHVMFKLITCSREQ